MFCLRVFKYNNNHEVKIKQNKLELHLGFCVFLYLVAEVADKFSLEMVLKEENSIYIFFSSFTVRESNSKDDNFLLFEMQSTPIFFALFNYYKHNLTFAIFTSGDFFFTPPEPDLHDNHSKILDILLTVGLKIILFQ